MTKPTKLISLEFRRVTGYKRSVTLYRNNTTIFRIETPYLGDYQGVPIPDFGFWYPQVYHVRSTIEEDLFNNKRQFEDLEIP